MGFIRNWNSRWFSKKESARFVEEDFLIRRYFKEKLSHAGVARIEIERARGRVVILVFSARPGIVIGRKGTEIELMRKELQDRTGKDIYINIQEVRNPELEAQLVAEGIASQLEKRIAFRRAMKKAIETTMKGRTKAKGIKVMVSGRLAEAEIARRVRYYEGKIPAHTLRADIDYGFAEALTTYGKIGVKVWIFRDEKLDRFSAEEKSGQRAQSRHSKGHVSAGLEKGPENPVPEEEKK